MKLLWHSLSLEEIEQRLNTNFEKGLSEKEVEERKRKFGENKLPEKKKVSPFLVFFSQFKSPLMYILVIAGGVTLFLKEFTDSIVIFGAVLVNAIVGFIQEYKAMKAFEVLKKVIKVKALVLREGRKKETLAEDLVPGDIVFLKAGDKVPADGRIIEARGLEVNEAVLTGESIPSPKSEKVLPKEVPLADRENMVYMGSVVEGGEGKIVVTSIGTSTEFGKIAQSLKEIEEEKTPYQKKLASFSKIIAIFIVIICFFIFIEGMIRLNQLPIKERFEQMFTTAVAIAVAAIPEGLPIAMTVILALGMQRIFKKKGLVRKLVAAETLGSTSVICTDKTGTLTEGKMRLAKLILPQEIIFGENPENLKKERKLLLKSGIFSSEVFIENPSDPPQKWILKGSATEKAIVKKAIESGIDIQKLEKEEKEIWELPFYEKNKFSASLREKEGEEKVRFYIKGAPEILIEVSRWVETKEGKKEISFSEKEKLLNCFQNLAKEGFRVLAGAIKEEKEKKKDFKAEEIINDLVFLGFFVLEDPIRPQAKEAIKKCQEAGMKVIIVTGDHKLTAMAVARKVGLEVKEDEVLEGKDLEKISDRDLKERIEKIKIFARVEPVQKLRIVKAWQERGEIVAMTGDGVNDSPALKKADVGIALGSGSDVAREVSDLVLLEDNFSVIVAAVEEGRGIVDNIRKVITYLLSDSFTEVILVGVSILARIPLPILPAQILWINLIEDSLPNMALAFEPKEKDIMKRKPEKEKPLLTGEMKFIIFAIGILTDFILLAIFFWLWQQKKDINYIRTVVFACLAIDSLFYVFSCKSLRKNIWQIDIFSNKYLIWAVIGGILMLFLGIYLPPFQSLLKTTPLGIFEWGLILATGMIEIFLLEMTKLGFNRFKKS